MKRNRKKCSTQDRERPSASAKLKEENDLAYFVDDRVSLMREVFSILKPKEIKAITPECVRNLSIDNLEELCLEELLGISSKRLCAVLDGAEPPTDTESSSSSSGSSASDKEEQSTAAAIEEVICLDSDSNAGSVRSKQKKKKKKKKRKRKRKSTENTTTSDATVESESTEQNNTKKTRQTPSKSIQTPTPSNNLKNKQDQRKTTTNAAIFPQIGGRLSELFSEKGACGKEASRAAQRVGMTVLEILEVQARARAIKAKLNKEQNDASQAGPSTSTSHKPSSTQNKPKDSSDSEVEIKEETADVVNLLSSSDDDDDDNEEKPRVEELEVVVVQEPDPQPAATKEKVKTKIKKTNIAKPKLPETITTEEPTNIITSENPNKSTSPAKTNRKRSKGKPNSEKNKESETTGKNTVPNHKEKLPNDKNKLPITETQVAKTVPEEIKQESEERESSPDLIILEDSDSEKTSNHGNKKPKENTKSTENIENSVQSISKVIDAPQTAKSTKTSHKNDFTITVTQNNSRKIRKNRDNVVISFSNDANSNKPEEDGNSFISSTQKKNRLSDCVEQSARKLNSIVTKIIKERPKGKYVKSVVQKTDSSDRDKLTNTKDRDKTSDERNKDKNRAQERQGKEDKESDSYEITLQLSDSEKMDLLEDLNPKTLDKVSEHTESDSKSSNDDDSESSSDETVKSDQQNANSDQDIIETEVSHDTEDKKDINEETCNKNDNSNVKIAKTTNNDKVDINEINTNISKPNLITSDITIPKTITNDIENDLNLPVKTIISHLRVDEMVLDAPKIVTKHLISEDTEKTTNLNITAENIAKEGNVLEADKVINKNSSESNLTKEATEDNVYDSSRNKDSNPINNEKNLNVIEIRSVKDIPILPDYESDNEASSPREPNLEPKKQEICIDKDLTRNKTRKKLKKIRKRTNRNRASCSSSDDIVGIDDGLRVKDKKNTKGNNTLTDDTTNITKPSNLEDSEQTRNTDKGLLSVHEKDKIESSMETSRKKDKISIKDTDNIPKETNNISKQTDTISISLETMDDDVVISGCDDKKSDCDVKTSDGASKNKDGNGCGKTSDSDAETSDGGNKKEEGNGCGKKSDSKTSDDSNKNRKEAGCDKRSDAETSDCSSKKRDVDTEAVEIPATEAETHKIPIVDPTAATLDTSESEVIVPETSEVTKEIESKDVVELAEVEEGEITDDYKRQLSEEGETTTGTESEVEAHDVVPETICISDEEKCTANTNDKTTDNKDSTKITKHKKLCKKCKRKKDFQKKVYRNSKRDLKLTNKESIVDQSPTNTANIIERNIATLNSDISQVNDDNKKELVIDNISLDSESDSDSDSNETATNIIKVESKNSLRDKSEPEIDSDTLETLEISDDSSDCYEILSKEPTSKEIEELSKKIDRIDRIEVVTTEEIMQHELSNDSNEVSNHEFTKNPENEDEKSDENVQSHNSNDNDTEPIADDNITWKDRYIKSKNITKELTTSNNSNDNDTEPIADENISWKDRYIKSKNITKELTTSNNSNDNDNETISDENISWKDRYIKSKKVTKVLTTSNILNSLRKRNLILKKKLLESKMAKSVEDVKEVEIEPVLPETVQIGSIEHYNTLESSTKYVDPVQEPSNLETDSKDINLNNEPEAEKTTDNETLVSTTTETQIVTKEMKKEAKQLLKMYKKLLKHNNMFKERDPNKKKKKKSKNKDGDASCSSVVTEKV